MARNAYKLVVAPTPAQSLDANSVKAIKALRALLDSGECDEVHYQKMLEDYPVLIPGTYPAIDAGQNGFFPGVITQPRLTGLKSKLPDFGVISWDSGTVYAALIELESPCKKWATKGGLPSAKLTQALQQLRDWQIWFDNPNNLSRFREEYDIPADIWHDRAFELRTVLVYGRRTELEQAKFQKQRAKLTRSNEVLMTWDRIEPNRVLYDALVVRLTPKGYVALKVPPTVQLGPRDAEIHSFIACKQEAVLKSNLVPLARRRFLANRWEYWDEWARTKNTKEQSWYRYSDAE